MNRVVISSKGISIRPWGHRDDKEVLLFRIENKQGSFVEVCNYGATLISVVVPNRYGKLENVILGFPSLEGYLADTCYIGSTIGRFANRIGQAQFKLNGSTYSLEKNDEPNTNHGGMNGFNSKVFDCTVKDNTLSLTLLSKDGEGGYPGNIQFSVVYAWNDFSELSISYEAMSDRRTIANFTNHAYFNLAPGKDDIFDHILTIKADKVLETNADYIPTGRILPADNCSFRHTRLRDRITIVNGVAAGLNTYYIFDKDRDSALEVCMLSEETSGRIMKVFTTYPGVQLYTGDSLTSTHLNNHAVYHKSFDGLCLECQHYPDSPNHANFPSTILEAGQVFREKIVFKFDVV